MEDPTPTPSLDKPHTHPQRYLNPFLPEIPARSRGSSATLQKSDCAASYWGNAVSVPYAPPYRTAAPSADVASSPRRATTLSKYLSVGLPLKSRGIQRPRSRDYTGRVSQDLP